MGGNLGNKGAVLVKFCVDDSPLCFICAHLEAGQKNLPERLQMISDIHIKAF
jgi:hypothetical protein